MGTIVKPGLGLDTAAIQTQDVTVAESTTLTETLLNIIPTNPIGALANGTMLQVIVFALFVGIILAKLGERVEVVSNFFAQFNDIMMEMTNMVMMAAPIGVYCLIARTFSNIGFSGFIPMAKYMLCVLGALAIHCLGSYSALMAIFTRLNPYRFIRKYFPVMSFAFSTATSNATIPMAIETLDEKIGVSKKISSFTIPLGATINMDGTAIMQGCCRLLCCPGIWHYFDTDGLSDCYCNGNISFHWYSRCAFCWFDYIVYGICFCWASCRGHCHDHGY